MLLIFFKIKSLQPVVTLRPAFCFRSNTTRSLRCDRWTVGSAFRWLCIGAAAAHRRALRQNRDRSEHLPSGDRFPANHGRSRRRASIRIRDRDYYRRFAGSRRFGRCRRDGRNRNLPRCHFRCMRDRSSWAADFAGCGECYFSTLPFLFYPKVLW